MDNIAVLTSGGDAPGMNAILYGLAESAQKLGYPLIGIREGLKGLCNVDSGECVALTTAFLRNWVNCGGTYLGTSRFPDFLNRSMQMLARERLEAMKVSLLLVIGGEGSYQAARALSLLGQPVIVIPASIDNDVPGTDLAVGFCSAMDRIDKCFRLLASTGYSHKRIEILEVMGRNCPDLAFFSGESSNCLCSITQDNALTKEEVVQLAHDQFREGSRYLTICVAENSCDLQDLANYLEAKTGHETRVTVLGQLQRGGPPNFYDKLFGKALGRFALDPGAISASSCALGLHHGKLQKLSLQSIFESPSPKSRPFFV